MSELYELRYDSHNSCKYICQFCKYEYVDLLDCNEVVKYY